MKTISQKAFNLCTAWGAALTVAIPFADRWGGAYWRLALWSALALTLSLIVRVYVRPLVLDKSVENVLVSRRLLLLLGYYVLYLMISGFIILINYGVLDLMSHRH